MTNYVFNKEEQYVSAWGFLPLLQGINEAINSGFEIDIDHPYTGANYEEYSFKVFLKKVDKAVDEPAIKKALLAYAKMLDAETNGQKYKTIDALLEKINAPTSKE